MGLFKFETPVKETPTQEVGKMLREQAGQKVSEATKRFKGFGSRLFGGLGKFGINTVDTLIGGAVKAPGAIHEGVVSGTKAVGRGMDAVDKKTTEGLDWLNKKVEGGQKWVGDRATDIQEAGKATWGSFQEKLSQANDWKNRMIEAHREANRQKEIQSLIEEQHELGARNNEIQRRLDELQGINQLESELELEAAAA